MPVLKASCLTEMKKGKLYVHGVDNEGHPLLIWDAGKHDCYDRDVDELVRLVIWWFQYVCLVSVLTFRCLCIL